MKNRNLYIILTVVVLMVGILVIKTFDPFSKKLPDLHAKNQDYQAEINLAIKNHQPLFVEFYGEY